jgi:uncharacterized protein YkwD
MRAACLASWFFLCACGPRAVEFGSWRAHEVATPEIAGLEAQMFARLNRDRATLGLAPLTWDPQLADIARAHSLDMRRNSFFAHESPGSGLLEDRMLRAGYLAFEMRENLAVAANVERAQDNLLASKGHYANIMAPSIHEIGIGIVTGGLHGDPRGLTVTQVFARKAVLETPEQATESAAAKIAQARTAVGLVALTRHPLLEAIARAQVAELDDEQPGRSLEAVAEAASQRLSQHPLHGIRGLQVYAQLLFQGAELEASATFTAERTRTMGVAAAPAKDRRGRPRLKLLVLFGE